MRVEKVPDATYEMVGGLDKQIREIKEVIELPIKHPELFESLGISQPKVYVERNKRESREKNQKRREIVCMKETDGLCCCACVIGCDSVRPAGYRQDPARPSRGTSH
jgi:hypothetical protein